VRDNEPEPIPASATDVPATPTGVARPLSDDLAAAAAVVVERLLARLLGRTYSPRIKLLTINQVAEVTTLGESTIYKLVAAGLFPKPQLKLGKNVWRESRLIEWVEKNDPN
jgi:predicted DNA-binding transcriptional regulator AlpA